MKFHLQLAFKPIKIQGTLTGPDVRRALLTRVAGDSTGELRWPSAVDAAVWAAVELRRVRPPVATYSAGRAAARRLDRRGAPSCTKAIMYRLLKTCLPSRAELKVEFQYCAIVCNK